MISKKICLLGAVSVGKTSLIRRFVHGMFSEKYLTTVGVKIDRKTVRVDDEDLGLIIWDLSGEDEFTRLRTSYLRGASGYILVVDGTRRSTLETAVELQGRARETIGSSPFVLVLNKADLSDEWDMPEATLSDLAERGWVLKQTSARTGDGVEEVFELLANQMLAAVREAD